MQQLWCCKQNVLVVPGKHMFWEQEHSMGVSYWQLLNPCLLFTAFIASFRVCWTQTAVAQISTAFLVKVASYFFDC